MSDLQMAKTLPSEWRPQTWREEVANSVSAGVGLLAVMAGIPLLVSSAIQRGDHWSLVGTIIFALAMVSLYLASTIYHAVPQGKTKEFFHLLDHSAIYVLIAGTYTPFALGVLRGAWGWTLFGVVWSLAGTRHLFQSVWRVKVSTALAVDLPRHGMDGIGRDSSFLASCPARRIALDFRGRSRLHLRGLLLCRETASVRPPYLASVCDRGNSVPFLRCHVVCRVTRGYNLHRVRAYVLSCRKAHRTVAG